MTEMTAGETTGQTPATTPFPRVLVVGAGAMGAQIAMVVALSGREVVLVDLAAEALEKGVAGLHAQMDKRVAKGRLSQAEVDAAFARLSTSTELTAGADVDLVIEAIVEKLDVKRSLFAQLDDICPPDAVLASNSSSFVPSSMADATSRPERFLNLHFFNPALVMKAVEVVAGPSTDPALMDVAVEFVRGLGKEPVVLQKEINGFVANRILNAVRDEALYLVDQGVASVGAIDAACRSALGYPMGPFELMDLTGLDIGYLVKKARFEASGDPKDAPQPLLAAKVEAGELGRKTGRGWYVYDENGQRVGEA